MQQRKPSRAAQQPATASRERREPRQTEREEAVRSGKWRGQADR